jgi:hypothetical protein
MFFFSLFSAAAGSQQKPRACCSRLYLLLHGSFTQVIPTLLATYHAQDHAPHYSAEQFSTSHALETTSYFRSKIWEKSAIATHFCATIVFHFSVPDSH